MSTEEKEDGKKKELTAADYLEDEKDIGEEGEEEVPKKEDEKKKEVEVKKGEEKKKEEKPKTLKGKKDDKSKQSKTGSKKSTFGFVM